MALDTRKDTVEISIAVAAHREGLIAHKTMLSIKRACQKLKLSNINYEVVVTIDNGNDETKNYFKTYNDSNTRVYNIAAGDLATARNFAVSNSHGKYIATVDADDLVSENWFVEAYKLLKSREGKAIVHTQVSINFGTQDIIWLKTDSRSKEEDALIMVQANRWDSALMANREVFEQYPYQPNQHGFGSEDWHFNSQTLAANIKHLVVPKTILFVRRKDVSEMTIQARDKRTVHYTDLLDIDFMRSIDALKFNADNTYEQQWHRKAKRYATRGAKIIYKLLNSNPRVGKYTLAAKNRLLPSFESKPTPRFEPWLLEEWRAAHTIEKSIFPSKQVLSQIPIYESEMYELGKFYHALVQQLHANYSDYIIFVPYLTRGGADLVAINYANALKRLRPKIQITVVATENTPSPWAERLDEGIDFIPFGEIAQALPDDLKLQVLARLIIQLKAKKLHIIQSSLAFKFAEQYKSLLMSPDNNFSVYACAFCEDEDNEGRIAGHVHSGIPGAYKSITKIFTDNSAISKLLVEEYGFSTSKFKTHYQPIALNPHWKPSAHSHMRILWAGRIAKQKRPDILIEIAKKLNPSMFTIDVYGSFQDGYSREIFSNTPSIRYQGEFNGLLSLPLADYDLYLYTSENDGLPNTLIEVVSVGLPVIASRIGGIPELIKDGLTGITVTCDSPMEYVDAIKKLHGDDQLLQKFSSEALKLAETQHSKKYFESVVKNDILEA